MLSVIEAVGKKARHLFFAGMQTTQPRGEEELVISRIIIYTFIL